jgi:hypothetical protein
MMLRRALLALVIPALVAGMTAPVVAQEAPVEQIPSVSVHPQGTTKTDPNGGQWFVTSIAPLETKELQVRISNPAEVPQQIKLYLADIRFDASGIPEVANISSDIGTWGRFDNPTITIGPRQPQVETFSITAPKAADPGDHVGAVVVEHTPQGTGNILSVKRVAVRLYATLPGDARREFEIDNVGIEKDSAFFARELTVTVALRNTGRVRLEPSVQVDGAAAKGPELLMSSAVERYVVTRPVKFWGGPVRLRIDAQTRSLGVAGPVRQMRVTVWVIPWHLLVLIALVAGIVLLVRMLLRRRGSKLRAMQADLMRIERLITQQRREDDEEVAEALLSTGAQAAIRAAIKQAKRTGDFHTVERLEQKLGARSSNGRARTKT